MAMIFYSVIAFIIVSAVINTVFEIKNAPRYRIFFEVTDAFGIVRARNTSFMADNEKDAEKRFKRMFSNMVYTNVVIHTITLVKPDSKIDIIDPNDD